MRLGVEAALVDGRLLPGDVEISGGQVAAVGLSSPTGRGIAAPGFVDIQVNGFAGIDFLDADSDGYARAGTALLETGVTAYLPTFISTAEDRLLAALRAVPLGLPGPRILGAHVEGPFISPYRLGTHPPEARRDPDLALAERIVGAGPVRLLTLAPELPGAGELITFLQIRGVIVSLGHTDASAAEAGSAFDRGVNLVTHLFNAMRPFGHRDPGVAGAALTREGVVLPVIVDGVHLAPEAVKLAWQAAPDRIALISDAMAAAGCGDGEYRLGDIVVVARDGVVRRASDGVLAGSALTMIEALRNLHALGAPLEQALGAASAVPSRALRVDRVGRLAPGATADIVVLTDGLEVERVLVGGETLVAV